ncbi:hypothetical protein COCSADRAFT_239373 [Bipolaris sorokiniana ND90Pr]|uniref:Uncharacterized protein n=1 Tax=Cochliobolus sativus (strain ND90Pr / ATCC 201652) TaxID=665912 RepID=M2S1K1_COCSN|nr:uncharacterized protein COCSADRAFT_239373 [Bipolaris sorokiniana ND90Pr]EMD61108.1 hypothetical protein COCSADRAFT_239373 [Bipolaris sorokiniana ND90Pr]
MGGNGYGNGWWRSWIRSVFVCYPSGAFFVLLLYNKTLVYGFLWEDWTMESVPKAKKVHRMHAMKYYCLTGIFCNYLYAGPAHGWGLGFVSKTQVRMFNWRHTTLRRLKATLP